MFENLTSKLAVLAVTFAAQNVSAQSQEDKEAYPEFAQLMEASSYAWESLLVETDDGWTNSIFRVTGKIDEDGEVQDLRKEGLLPVIIQHGGGMDAQDFLTYATYTGGISWVLQLYDRGYDVFLPNNRGTRYSNVNARDTGDDAWTEQERWAFTYADYGRSDQPAFIEKALEVSGAEKLTYIGYSAGSAQMFYGAATEPEYFEEKLNRFVALAPCLISFWYTPEELIANYQPLFDLGIYKFGGEDWAADQQLICDNLVDKCQFYTEYWVDGTVAFTAMNEAYFMQNGIADRF